MNNLKWNYTKNRRWKSELNKIIMHIIMIFFFFSQHAQMLYSALPDA